MGFTVKDIVDRLSPHHADRKMYNGEKKTLIYSIDILTGRVLRTFSTGGSRASDDSTCQLKTSFTGAACDPSGEEVVKKPRTILLGRTEYTINIETYDPLHPERSTPSWTIKYSEWGPNNSDRDLASQHQKSQDNKYIYPVPTGEFYAFTHPSSPHLDVRPTYHGQYPSPVIRVFDIFHGIGSDSGSLILLPQPIGPKMNDKDDKMNPLTYVGVTKAGNWFAMSGENYRLVGTGGQHRAACYTENGIAHVGRNLKDKKDKLVGLHRTHNVQPVGMNKPYVGGTVGRGVRGGLVGGRQQLLPGGQYPPDKRNSNSQHQYSPQPESYRHPSSVLGIEGDHVPNDRMAWLRLLRDTSVLVMVLFTIAGLFWMLKKQNEMNRMMQANMRVQAVEKKEIAPVDEEVKKEEKERVEETPRPQTPVQVADEKAVEDEKDSGYGSTSTTPTRTASEPPAEANLDGEPTPRPKAVHFADPEPNSDGNLSPSTSNSAAPAPSDINTDALQISENDPPETPKKKKKAHRGYRGGAAKRKRKEAAEARASAALDDPIGEVVKQVQELNPVPKGPEADVHQFGDTKGDEVEGTSCISINGLRVSEDILGFGSHGTVVYRGRWEDREVAVKRMLNTFFDLASHEVRLLQESDFHANVIRYYCKQSSNGFMYIALELCEASLHEIIVNPASYTPVVEHLDPRECLRQMAEGIRHLHSLKIVHRDLKPQNILVQRPKILPRGEIMHPRLVISDFGLCKKLEGEQSSFRATTAQAAGTTGWRAPELLTEESDITPNPNSQSSGGGLGGHTETSLSASDAIVDPTTNRRATRAIDIFSLGCVFYFTLTNGSHPFGDRYLREANIVRQIFDLSGLELLDPLTKELSTDLIKRMISHNPKKRPDALGVLRHPFFWPADKTLSFLLAASDYFESLPREPPHEHLAALEAQAPVILATQDFYTKLSPALVENLGKYRKYQGNRLLDLLRVIRNKKHHYQDLPEALRKGLGGLPDGYLSYFTGRWPKLVGGVWDVVRELREEIKAEGSDETLGGLDSYFENN